MATIFCMRCGASLEEGTRFCTHCGTPTMLGGADGGAGADPISCPACGAENDAGNRFCRECGTRLEGEAAGGAAEPEGRPRQDAGTSSERREDLGSEATVRMAVPDVAAGAGRQGRLGSGREGQTRVTRPVSEEASFRRPSAARQSSATKTVAPMKTGVSMASERARERRIGPPNGALVALVVALALGAGALAVMAFSGALGFGGKEAARVEEPQEVVLDTDAPTAAEEPQEEAVIGSAGVEVHPALADYSWSDLSIIGQEMSRLGTRDAALGLAREYHLVDDQGAMVAATKDVDIAGLGKVPMRLVDVMHDDRADGEGKAGLTFLAADLTLTHAMKVKDDNIGGWEGSQLRAWLNSEVYGALDAEVAPMVVAVDKHTDNVGKTTDTSSVTSTLDRLWVPSVVEITGPINWEWASDADNSGAYNAVLNAEGSQYAYFSQMQVVSTEANQCLVMAGNSGVMSWWLRSCSASKDAHYRTVDESGDPSRFEGADVDLGVCLGFCL